MNRNGATHLHRLLAFLLTCAMLMTTCFTPAIAADIWDDITLSILWTDDSGITQIVPAIPVPESAEPSYWAYIDAAAYGDTLSVEVNCPDPAYSFYFPGESDASSISFVWDPSMDAQGLGYEYAYYMLYAVDGVPGDTTIQLYVSSLPMPDGDGEVEFEPFPVQVPVYYVTADGVMLDSQYAECWAGDATTVWASSGNTEGYELLGSNSVDVYVDESGLATPSEVAFTYAEIATPTPEPTEEPTPTPIAEVVVPVVYYHVNGEPLDYQEILLPPGTHTIQPDSAQVEGYVLVGDAAATITIYPDGTTDPASIVFQYEDAAPAEAVIPVYYYHVNGSLLDMQEVILTEGTHTITANSGKVEGYVLAGESSVTITVYADGSADQASVVFQYEDAVPAEAVIPVYYYHEDGTLLDMQEVTLSEGTHTITASSDKVEGYVLAGESSVTITVYADGSADQASVVFQYEDAAPAEAVIPVYYYHEDGTLLDMQEVTLTEGTHTITASSDKVADLDIITASTAEVVVYADGSANAAAVQFIYKTREVVPVEVTVTVNYLHIDAGLIDSQTISLTEGVHTVEANSSKVSGYLPLGSTSVEVTVYPDGSTHPGAVEFYYEDAYVAPVTAELAVYYLLANGTPIAQDTVTLTPGEHTIEPDVSKINGYALEGDQAFVVHVDEKGGVSPESIQFVCAPATVTVVVHYQDDRGRNIAPDQTLTFSGDGEYVIKAAPEDLPEEYELAPGQNGEQILTVAGGVAKQPEFYFYYQQKQSAPAMANVTVCYYDTYGEEIAPAQNIMLQPGIHQVNAKSAETFRGYELVSEPSITVEVFENGTFTPQEVAFYYRPIQAEEATATVTVYFRDDRGNDVAPSQTLTLGEGEHVIKAEPVDLLPGYEIFTGTDSEMAVTVRDGVATKSQIVFYYQKAKTEQTVFTLPVNYYDTEGQIIATTQYVQVGPGTYAIQANPIDLPEGYELMMDAVLTVVVNRDGTTNPEEIGFYYRAPEKKATVLIVYVNEDGQRIAEPFTTELAAGYHTLKADASRVPSGYDPDSAEPVKVYVSREGEANPAQVTLAFERLIVETPIPVGEFVYRYAKVTSNSVAFRNEPSTSGGNKTVIKRLGRSDEVYVLQELYNDQNELWAMVNVDGRIGYMMSKFLDVMTQQQSDEYGQSNTPVPTFTPAPTATPIPTPTPTVTPVPTATPTQPLVELISPPPAETATLEPLPTETASPTPTATPIPTATPTPYTGYGLTTRATALRTGISASDMTIMQALEANTLVHVVNQIADPVTGEVWSIVSTLNNQAGFVQDASLRYISDKEAEPYLERWEELNKEPELTDYVTATPEPMQLQGYGVVLGDGVPFRQMQSEFSRIIDNLDAGTMVYITGQTLGEGQYWHSVNYEGHWGYIRTDLVRMLTIAEEEDYIESLNATPTPTAPDLPFNENGLSSYGYVDGSSVNWREGPSTSDKKVGELKRYAFCLVLGTEYVNGVTWYHVNYGDKSGYIHGDFFKQMTISELEDFLGSEEYLQGVTNNSASGEAARDEVGFTGTGGLISAEDQWVHNNTDLIMNTTNPWQPIPTVQPIVTTPTLEPLPGVTATPYITPTPTPTFNPLPDVTYPTTDGGDGGSTVLWVFVIGLLLLAVGGVFALVRYQQNRRRIAMRAAQRRAQAARAQQQQQQRPYARTAATGQPQPRTGTYPNQQTPVRQPASSGAANQSTTPYKPYSGATNGYGTNNAYRPAENTVTPANTSAPVNTSSQLEGAPQRNPRVGRRTAYRQAQENANQSGEGNNLDM